MLIDSSLFIGEINVANKNQPDVAENLNIFIYKYEPEILKKILGLALYTEFNTGLGAVTPDQKWIDLRDGVDYTYNDQTFHWRGLVEKTNTSPERKQSLIANYVYFHYMQNLHTLSAGIGEVKTVSENSELSNAGLKMTRAWNEMYCWILELEKYLTARTEDYSSYSFQWSDRRSLKPVNIFGI